MGFKDLFERRKIAELPKNVADRIAAGEVVDRPLSIVKELVENSIDAGADSVVVEIKNGGKSYIRITDNGCGIPSDDVETAFYRHATNKIKNDSDLFEISTLGFRGEALASIAAVTRTQMITKIPEETAGINIRIEGGTVTEKNSIGAADGTTIIVTDLFYNTPVREKFMKKDSTESTLIIDFISKLTLAYPNIKFKFINNGKILFSTNGKGNILENIYMVYGREIAEKLISFENSEDGINAIGYISNPVYTKTTRKNQFFFVNGRYIINKMLDLAITEGYGDKIPEGRQPVAYIFIDVPPDSVDVNIHPNKREIRFHDTEKIKNLLKKWIFVALNSKEAVSNISEKTVLQVNREFFEPESYRKSDKIFADKKNEAEMGIQTKLAQDNDGKVKFYVDPDKFNIIDLSQTDKKEMTTEYDELTEKKDEKAGTQIYSEAIGDSSDSEKVYELIQEEAAPEIKPSLQKFNISELKVLGIIFNTYIIAYDRETFFMIDQHAAHERVFYEQFLREFNSRNAVPQMILTPIVKKIGLSVSEEFEDNWFSFLIRSGFDIELFGDRTYIIKGIPNYMDIGNAERFLDDYIENINQNTNFKDRKTLDRIIMKSCKSAVKANDRLSMDEAIALIRDLSMTNNPYSCPHGRPVIIKLGKNDIEKMFKRTGF